MARHYLETISAYRLSSDTADERTPVNAAANYVLLRYLGECSDLRPLGSSSVA